MLLRADQAIELLSMFVDGPKQTCRGGLTMSVHGCRAEMDQPLASNLDFSARVSRVLMAHPLPASLAATPSQPLKGPLALLGQSIAALGGETDPAIQDPITPFSPA